jgi:glycosyltransferase involved in cell wall biosynthesis
MQIALFHNLPSGGAKRTLYEATKRLATKHRIDVYTLTSASHRFADIRPYVASHNEFEFAPLPLLSSPFGRLNQAVRLLDLLRLGVISRSIAQKIEQYNYDVVLVHPCQFEKSPTILKYLQSPPSVYYCHEPLRQLYETMPPRPYDDSNFTRRQLLNRVDPLPALYLRALKRVDQRNTRHAGTVLVNSKFTSAAVHRIYQVDAPVSYHGVDTDSFRPLSLQKQDMVLSVGSLTPLKGFDFLVQAMAALPHKQRPNLMIASNFQNAPEKQYLEQLAFDLDVDMTLLGNVDDSDLVQHYNYAKVVVYAPIREPFGLVPLEAMACGTPVVGVREGGVPETVVDQRTGLLVERDPVQFAEAVRSLLDDTERCQRFGHQARHYVLDRWTWDQATANLEDHLIDSASTA